jgi:uncharacterized protein YjbJ (UPF0337 family)
MLLMPLCNTSKQAGPPKVLLEKGNWAMSTATENKMKGKYDEVAGKVKQAVGEATHNDKIANKGAAQQVKGHAEQAWGSVKSAANDTAANAKARANESRAVHEDEHERKAHDVRQSVTSTAQNVKNHIQNSVDDFRAKH